MKPLYYLEIAQSVDDNDNIIPANSFIWYVPRHCMIAYEDREQCNQERIDYQSRLRRYVVRVKKAGWLKNIGIRLNSCDHFNHGDWVIYKS